MQGGLPEQKEWKTCLAFRDFPNKWTSSLNESGQRRTSRSTSNVYNSSAVLYPFSMYGKNRIELVEIRSLEATFSCKNHSWRRDLVTDKALLLLQGVVIIYGRGAVEKGGTQNLSASSLRGGAKFQCTASEGGGKIWVHYHLSVISKWLKTKNNDHSLMIEKWLNIPKLSSTHCKILRCMPQKHKMWPQLVFKIWQQFFIKYDNRCTQFWRHFHQSQIRWWNKISAVISRMKY